MAKFKKSGSFLAGVFTALLACVCVTSALAASGAVTFNTANVSVNGHSLLTREESLRTSTGASIPSTILYTDEQGNTTNYVPLREFAEAFHMEVDWASESRTVNVTTNSELGLHFFPLYHSGAVYDKVLEEVEPVPIQEGTALLKETRHQGTEAFEAKLTAKKADGDYVSVTITNHESKPLVFGLGRSHPDLAGNTELLTQVPAGETVTRTLRILDADGLKEAPIHMSLRNWTDVCRTMDATISAVQFDK